MRLYDAKDIEADRPIALAVAINQESIQDDFKERFEAFCTWFGVMFLDRENQQIFIELFDLGIKFGSYFDHYLWPLYSKSHLPELKKI